MQDNAYEVQKMINTQDQEELFRLIAEYLEKDISCTAIGGTAMMFSGYKNTTKDIDIIFRIGFNAFISHDNVFSGSFLDI